MTFRNSPSDRIIFVVALDDLERAGFEVICHPIGYSKFVNAPYYQAQAPSGEVHGCYEVVPGHLTMTTGLVWKAYAQDMRRFVNAVVESGAACDLDPAYFWHAV